MSDAFAHLDDEQRRKAQALAATFRELGSGEPEEWALSEVEDDVPQLARYLFLRRMWRSADEWRLPPDQWFAGRDEDEAEPVAEEDDDEPTLVSTSAEEADAGDEDADPPFLAARQAVARMLAAGVDPEDVKELARAVFVHAFYDAVRTLDEGFDPLAPEGTPGWLLTEVGGDLTLTGRMLENLHEDLFTTEPDQGEQPPPSS
jgi:hypothetical protein